MECFFTHNEYKNVPALVRAYLVAFAIPENTDLGMVGSEVWDSGRGVAFVRPVKANVMRCYCVLYMVCCCA